MKEWEMPAVAIRMSTCLETKIDQPGPSDSTEVQMFLAAVSRVTCRQTSQPLTPNAHEWIKGLLVLKRRIEFYCISSPVHLPLLLSFLQVKVVLTSQPAKQPVAQCACLPPLKQERWWEQKHPSHLLYLVCTNDSLRQCWAPLKPQPRDGSACKNIFFRRWFSNLLHQQNLWRGFWKEPKCLP